MWTRFFFVLDVLAKEASQVLVVDHDHSIEQLAPPVPTPRSAIPLCHGLRSAPAWGLLAELPRGLLQPRFAPLCQVRCAQKRLRATRAPIPLLPKATLPAGFSIRTVQ